jgi:hypothetical protein
VLYRPIISARLLLAQSDSFQYNQLPMYHGLGATHFDETVQTVPVLGLGASFLHPRLDIVERHRGICFTVSGDLHNAKELAVLTDSDQSSGGTRTEGRGR